MIIEVLKLCFLVLSGFCRGRNKHTFFPEEFFNIIFLLYSPVQCCSERITIAPANASSGVLTNFDGFTNDSGRYFERLIYGAIVAR
jgi:hypothetical protein